MQHTEYVQLREVKKNHCSKETYLQSVALKIFLHILCYYLEEKYLYTAENCLYIKDAYHSAQACCYQSLRSKMQ